jgi:starvation-inducible DNA-binding protein
VAARSWDDYSIGRDDAIAHLGALDVVYAGIIETHRKAIMDTEEPDPVTQDILINQAETLEQYHWFVRAHLESPSGSLSTSGARTEHQGASRARK